MEIQEIKSEVWNGVVSGNTNYSFEFLALKILLSRLRLEVKANPLPSTVWRSAAELKEFFIKQHNLPVAQRDLQKILQNAR